MLVPSWTLVWTFLGGRQASGSRGPGEPVRAALLAFSVSSESVQIRPGAAHSIWVLLAGPLCANEQLLFYLGLSIKLLLCK